MATVNQIKTQIDTFQAANWSTFVDVQDAYFLAHGHYWQGIATPDGIPDNGAALLADYTKRPADQIDRWLDVLNGGRALPGNLPCQIQVDTYDGPLGQGWAVTVRFTKTGITYEKAWSVGPENRAFDWREAPLPPVVP